MYVFIYIYICIYIYIKFAGPLVQGVLDTIAATLSHTDTATGRPSAKMLHN